jgi:ParB family chromosome partitioning protein
LLYAQLPMGENANTRGVGLAGNAVREAMHPADEFEALRELIEIDGRASLLDVPARCGAAESTVENDCVWPAPPPAILDAHRNDEWTFEQL